MDYSSILQSQVAAPFPGSEAAPMAQGEQPLPQSVPAQEPAQQQQQQPGFMEKLRTNPALSQAALMMGARMMMGPKPGQDALGVLGESMMIGNHTYTMGKQNEVENEQTAQRTNSEVQRNDAVTKRTELQTAQDEAAFPGLLEKTKAEIVRLEAAGQYEKARAIGEIYDNQPERLAKMFGLKVQAAEANISQSRASAGASAASAANSYAHAARVKDEMKDPSKYHAGGAAASLTRSTFLPQLLTAKTKELDIVTQELTMASSSERQGLRDQQKALRKQIDGYTQEMEKMSKLEGPPAEGGTTQPAGQITIPPLPPGIKKKDLQEGAQYDFGARGIGTWNGTDFTLRAR
jgi:hypothetical protein